MDQEEIQRIIDGYQPYENCDWEAPVTTPRRACLPVELYRPILEAMYKNTIFYKYTLRFLLFTSQAWRAEAERKIYTDVVVPEYGLLLFARTIIARPDLGQMVRSLQFCRALPQGAPTPEDVELFDTFLHCLPNVKDIRPQWNPSCSYSAPKIVDEENPKLFANRPFRLERFMAFSDWNLQTVEFLTTQPEIREFEIALCVKPAPKPEVVPHSVLRKCNMLITAPGILASFTVPPPLRFLHVYLNDWGTLEERLGEATEIGMFGNTLTSLAVARRYVREGYLSMAVILEGFAAQCSKLAVLGLYDCVDFSNRDNARIRRLVSDNFPNLRMFVWGPLAAGIWRNENDGWSSEEESDGDSMWSDDDDHTTVKMERYAVALMKAKPSLQLFVGFDGDGSCRHSRVWRRIGTGEDTKLEEILDHWRRFDIVEQELRYVDPNDPEEYMMTGYVNPKRFYVDVPMYNTELGEASNKNTGFPS
ncbi:hypothetical protein OF83DRAFT_1178317 [Amylostereum chailletii]|nr:hypothetical protein OF83DRAFT_1178317 [Amylostereum chailletii]